MVEARSELYLTCGQSGPSISASCGQSRVVQQLSGTPTKLNSECSLMFI